MIYSWQFDMPDIRYRSEKNEEMHEISKIYHSLSLYR